MASETKLAMKVMATSSLEIPKYTLVRGFHEKKPIDLLKKKWTEEQSLVFMDLVLKHPTMP